MLRLSLIDTVTDKDQQTVHAVALKLLARREHSRKQLCNKLVIKGYPAVMIERVLSSLEEYGYLSDVRYAEMYMRVRSEQGYGPVRIRAELRERGVDEQIIDDCLKPYRDVWLTHLARTHAKRFKPAVEFAERARQARFFQARGYTMEQIRTILETGKTWA